MGMKLEDIADIIIGILVNREMQEAGEYQYLLFNLKQEENSVITTNRRYDEKCTQPGDLVFRLVYPNKIIYIKESQEENKLISSQFCIIRIKEKGWNPIFLKWYLEKSAGKTQIQNNVTGSTVQKISVSELRKIKIPFIDFEIQSKLKEWIELWEKEKKVLEEIISKKENLYNSVMEEIIAEKEKENQ